jgi:MFS family permease
MPPQRLIIAALAFAGLASSFVFTAIVPIQAQLPDIFAATRDHTAWAVTSTLLASAVLTPVSGRLGDMYGKRRVLLALLAILAVGSIIAAAAPNLGVLIAGRAMQGAATGVVPLGTSILRDILHPHRLESAIAIVSATLGVGGAIGLPISALVSQYASWRWLFLATAVFAVVVALLILAIVPESTLCTGGRFDYLGAVGLVVAIGSLLLVVSQGPVWGWGSPPTLILIAVGATTIGLWGWYQLRVKGPLVNLRLAARKPVLLTNIAAFVVGFALFASNVVYPQLLEMPSSAGGFGLSLVQASLVMLPPGLIMLFLSPVAGALSRRRDPRWSLLIGAGALAVAYAFGAIFSAQVWQIVVTNILIGVGVGFGYAALPTLIIRAVPAHETGSSSGVNTLFRSLGTSIAAGAVGAVLAASASDGAHPSSTGFHTAILMGLAASLIAVVVTILIPRAERGES